MIRNVARLLSDRSIAGKQIHSFENHFNGFLRHFPEFTGTQPKAWSVDFARDIGGFHDVVIRWVGETLRVEMDLEFARYLHITRQRQLFTVVIWMMEAGPEAEHITFNLSDGEYASAARFAFSSFDPETKPLPDQYFFASRGFKSSKALAATAPDWHDRSDDIVWRGAGVGTGVFNPHPTLAQHPSVTQRIRLAHLCKGTEIDFAFVPNTMTERIWQPMLRAGLTGDFIPEESWIGRKYAIDIDGFTNTWSNLFVRLAYGCCVFKVASQFGYRQWYYDKLNPWEHYIPVKADMSDLFEQVAWARANPAECAKIAAQGQALVNTLTFESESKVAADTIRAFWDGKDISDAD